MIKGETMAYVISVSNIKGGVAKTSTTVSLGSSLAKTGYRVLVVDLDTQADLTLGLDVGILLLRRICLFQVCFLNLLFRNSL
jgi:cellulose biosynthesis protein BcsQ